MCSFKNKHNRFAAKIIGAVNNFVNKFWALQRKLAISPHFPKIPLKEAVVHTKPIEQSINQWNVKYSIFEPQPNDLKTRYSILASCLICPLLKWRTVWQTYYPRSSVHYTANVYRDLQGLCREIGVRGIQIYGDCMYTRNPCNFEISTLWFPCKNCRDFDFTGIL